MTAPDVLVALSVKDGAPYLAESVESVLAQEGVDLRLDVYDNGSTDGSVEIASRYRDDPRVRVVVNPPGLRFYATINRAAAGCPAPFLAPCACDDVMLPGHLATNVAALRAGDAGFVHGPARLVDADRNLIEQQTSQLELPRVVPAPELFRLLVPNNRIMLPTVLLRVEAFRAVGGFDARADLCADWLAWMALALRFPVATTYEALVEYRVHDTAASAGATRSGLWAEHEAATLGHALADPAFPETWRGDAAGWRASKYLAIAQTLRTAGHLCAGQGYAAYDLAARALALAPEAPGLRSLVERLIAEAGLVVPAFPLVAAARPALTSEAMGDAVAHLHRLARAGLAERLAIGVPQDRVDDAVALLEPVLDGLAPDLELDLVPLDRPEDVLALGTVVVAPVGDPLAASAEAAGIPVLTHRLPNPLDRPADLSRWDRLPVAA